MQKWCWRVLTIGSICLIYGIVERVNQLTNNVKFLIIIIIQISDPIFTVDYLNCLLFDSLILFFS